MLLEDEMVTVYFGPAEGKTAYTPGYVGAKSTEGYYELRINTYPVSSVDAIITMIIRLPESMRMP